MNRTVLGWSTLGVGLALAVPMTAASAQVPFKVSRPQDGARVRETVRIQMSRSALQSVKYLALSVDGKFRAGIAVPEVQYEKDGLHVKPVKTELVAADDKTVSILWNTKALVADPENPGMLEGVKDGPHTIDIIAFDALNKRVGKESLTLTVENQGGIHGPADGILLAYRFQVGEEVNYRQKTDVEYIGERKAPAAVNTGTNGFASQGRGQGGGFAGGGMPGGMGPGGMPGGMGPGGMPGGMAGRFGGGGSGGAGRRFGGGSAGPGGMPGGSSGMPGGGRFGGPGGMPGGSSGMMGGMGPGGMPGGGRFGGPMGGFGGAAGGAAFDATGPFTLPVQSVRANYERSTEDRSGAESFFIRDKVRDGTIVSGNGSAARLQDVYNFKSRYRTVATSGAVLDPGIANAAHPGAYVALPVIDLGGGRRRVGQTWSSYTPCLLEWATLDAPPMVRATNTLEALEWQDGYQTARIKQTFENSANIPIFGGLGEIQGAKVKMDRTIWFGFKAGRIIRMETTVEVEGDAPADVLSAMVPAAGIGGGGGGMMGGMGRMGGMLGGGSGATIPGQGGSGGNFGGMQGDASAETPTSHAKFKSNTVIELVPKVAPARTASAKTLPKPGR